MQKIRLHRRRNWYPIRQIYYETAVGMGRGVSRSVQPLFCRCHWWAPLGYAPSYQIYGGWRDDENTNFGIDLIEGEIDLDTNLAIEKFSKVQIVYAIWSQFHDDEDNPLFLIKNDKLAENILVMKYISEDENSDKSENVPVPHKQVVKT